MLYQKMTFRVTSQLPLALSSVQSPCLPNSSLGVGKGVRHQIVVSRLSSNLDALVRHKKWLKDVEAQKISKKVALEESSRIKSERRRKFKLSQAKKRRDYKIEAQANIHPQESDRESNPAKMDQVHIANDSFNKPAWALTETFAQSKIRSQMVAEEEALLDFIESLDLETLYHDLELNILVNHLKERIRTLEADRKVNQNQLQMLCYVCLCQMH